MAKHKYYVVWVGRETGIFTDWPTTQKLVSGFPKSRFKSYTTLETAKIAFRSGPEENTKKKPGKRIPKSVFELDEQFDVHIFCDGGCDPNPGKSGSGVAVYESGVLSARYYGLYQPMGTNNTAELNALHQSMILALDFLDKGKKVQILADSTYAIKAMTTWAADWQRRGWKRKSGELINAELIARMYETYLLIKPRINILHVKAHIGIEGNELADRLSLLAITEQETEFKLYESGLNVPDMLKMQSG
ncbi:MAG: viroplasmin family protein [Pseudomonadales bacterium]|nr:viroplasmin family protein [Pseudomonadales bacterium]